MSVSVAEGSMAVGARCPKLWIVFSVASIFDDLSRRKKPCA